MNLPKRIVSPKGITYAVKESKRPIGGKGTDALGALSIEGRTIIYVKYAMAFPDQIETLMHEMIHICDKEAREAGEWAEWMEEEMVEGIACRLFDMMATADLIKGIPSDQYVKWKALPVVEALG